MSKLLHRMLYLVLCCLQISFASFCIHLSSFPLRVNPNIAVSIFLCTTLNISLLLIVQAAPHVMASVTKFLVLGHTFFYQDTIYSFLDGTNSAAATRMNQDTGPSAVENPSSGKYSFIRPCIIVLSGRASKVPLSKYLNF